MLRDADKMLSELDEGTERNFASSYKDASGKENRLSQPSKTGDPDPRLRLLNPAGDADKMLDELGLITLAFLPPPMFNIDRSSSGGDLKLQGSY